MKMSFHSVLWSIYLFILASVFPLLGPGQTPREAAPSSRYDDKLKPVFQEWERADRPGGVVAVVEKGEVAY
ncbi:MAG: hypothetical protein AB1715_11655, partial [Acidobacteriota bacterium]